MQLVIGNKNYSTWSLRPWMLLSGFKLDFTEINESLNSHELTKRLEQYSASARVPVLIDGDVSVWDSLAICEYVSEQYLEGAAWPAGKHDRAIARSVVAEMHSGFAALRDEMPMNCRAHRKVTLSEAAQKDIQRVDDIWPSYAKNDSAADLRLFGAFSIADCFYAPVVMRFICYGIKLSDGAAAYLESMRAHPALNAWVDQALLESEVVEKDEAGVDI